MTRAVGPGTNLRPNPTFAPTATGVPVPAAKLKRLPPHPPLRPFRQNFPVR